MCPHASQQPTSASPIAGDHRPGGVPRRCGRQPQRSGERIATVRGASTGDPVSSVAAARVPAAPPAWTGSAGTAASVIGGVEHAGQPADDLRADGAGQRRLGQVRASIGLCRWVSASPARARHLRGRVRRSMRDSASRRQSISAVSMTSWLVSPRCSQRAGSSPRTFAQQRDQPDHGIAVGLGRLGAIARRHRGDNVAARFSRAAAGATPGVDEAVQPSIFDGDHRRQERSVAHQVAARVGPPARTGRSSPVARVTQEHRLAVPGTCS